MKVSRRRQITLPASLCEKYKVSEGDIVEFKATKRGILLEFRPATEDDDESWWLSEAWQKAHQEALEDIREGRLSEKYDNIHDFMKALGERILE